MDILFHKFLHGLLWICRRNFLFLIVPILLVTIFITIDSARSFAHVKIACRKMILIGLSGTTANNIVSCAYFDSSVIIMRTFLWIYSITQWFVKFSCWQGLLSHTEAIIIFFSLLYFIFIIVEFHMILISFLVSGCYCIDLMGVVVMS